METEGRGKEGKNEQEYLTTSSNRRPENTMTILSTGQHFQKKKAATPVTTAMYVSHPPLCPSPQNKNEKAKKSLLAEKLKTQFSIDERTERWTDARVERTGGQMGEKKDE